MPARDSARSPRGHGPRGKASRNPMTALAGFRRGACASEIALRPSWAVQGGSMARGSERSQVHRVAGAAGAARGLDDPAFLAVARTPGLAVIVLDAQGRVHFANEEIAGIAGLTVDAILG